MKKRQLFIILTAFIVFALVLVPYCDDNELLSYLGLNASANDITSGTCGTNLTWEYDSETSILTISGYGSMNSFGIGYYDDDAKVTTAPWEPFHGEIQSVVIGDDVNSIGNYAFSGCTEITSITIPNSVTSIGYWAFSDCYKLSSLSLPPYITSIGETTFLNCFALTTINIPSRVTSIGQGAFNHCTGLTQITIPSSVKTIGASAFFHCSGLKAITIPSTVTKLGSGAFIGCVELSSVTIPNGITKIETETFNNCKKLTSITIPDSITSIGNKAFNNCVGLTSITIPDSVTSLGEMSFYGCTGLKEIIVPNSVSSIGASSFNNKNVIFYDGDATGSPWGAGAVYKYYDGDLAFSTDEKKEIVYCKKGALNVVIPDSVTSIGASAFAECSSLTEISITNNIIGIGDNAFKNCSGLKTINYNAPNCIDFDSNSHWLSGCTSLSSVNIGSTVEKIPAYFIYKCSGITEIELPDSITSIGLRAFSNCIGLKSINIPAGVTSIGSYAFYGCAELTSITIPNSVASIDNYVFYSCVGLESVTIGNSVTSIGDYAFYYCNTLPEITIPNSVTSIGESAFYNCHDLETVIIPESVTSIGNSAFHSSGLTDITLPNSISSLGDEVFHGCKMTSIIIPESVKSIGEATFGACESLESVTLPDGLLSLGDAAFSTCPNLKSIIIPDSLKTISYGAFALTGLESVTIPKSVTAIEEDAFYECNNLEKVYYAGTKSDRTRITIGGENESLTNATWIYYKCGDNLCWDYEEETFTLTITGTGDMYDYDSSNNVPWNSFKGSIKTVEISNGATSIGDYAFYGCYELTSITVPNSITSIGNSAFGDCTELTEISLSENLTEIGQMAFGDCSGLTEIIIPDNVTLISSYAFRDCTSLSSVLLGNSVGTILDCAFLGCTSLTEITIPASVTEMTDNPFFQCTSLSSISVAEGNTVYHSEGNCIIDTANKILVAGCKNSVIPDDGSVTRIGRTAFICCPFTDFCIPNTVKAIDEYAFAGCSNLKTLTLSTIIQTIDKYAFADCEKLSTVYYDGTADDRNSIIIGTGNNSLENATWIYHSHTWDEGNVTKEATCKEEGSVVYTCTSCNYSYTETIPKTDDHDWQKFTITANCTQDGGDLYVCRTCGHSKLENAVPALGHDYVAKVTPATCEAGGFTTHTCSRCGISFTDTETPALSHNYEPFEVRTSCIQDGCTISICSNCGRSTKSDITPATGHTFGNWTVIRNAKENEEGLEQRRCTKCGYTEDRLIPMLERTTYFATFVADGKAVATVEFLKGATSIEEPAVPHKDRYEGKWSAYTLANTDITINAEYTLIDLDTVSGIESGKTATYNSATGEATINIYAASEGKTVVSTTSEKVPLDIILVVDQSGSMADKLGGSKTKQQALKTASTDFVNSVYADAKANGVDHRIAIVGFGMGNQSAQGYSAYQNTEILTTGGNPILYNNATAQNYANALVNVNNGGNLNAAITTAISNIDAKGATAADYGLSMANSIFANTDGEGRQRIVVFMTDGAPTYRSDFSRDVANAAVLQANQLKNTYGATVYSVGVMSASEAANSNIDTFMNYVSSNYADAENIGRTYTKQNDSFYIPVNNTNALSGVFTEIVTENITRTTDFDNLTVIDTISKYFTLTEKQERDLRISAIETYGVKNSDITVTRNENGTTTVIIKNLHPVDDGTKFSVNLSFKVSADEDALKAGTYSTNTEDAGLIIGDAENYECVFNAPSITIPADRTLSVFKINGEVYALLNADSANIPETDFIGDYEFTGWNLDAGTEIAEGVTEYNAVYVSKQDYVLIWNTDEGTQRLTVTPGDIIDEPAPAPDNAGNTFRRWNGEVPVTMPADNLEFTAVYGDHEHNYDAEIITPVTCLADGSTKYTCSICGHTYTEAVVCPGEHKWIAVTGSANTETGYEEFECEVCGEHCERTLEYTVTGTDESGSGSYNSITTELNYVNANGNNTQPDGNVNIVVPVSDYFDGAEDVDVYRVDGDGNKTECESDYSYGILSFFTNHFSTYEFVATYTEPCTHKDENNDGSCDLCGDPMTYTKDIIVDGNKIGEVTFTYGDTELTGLPEVPAKPGYTGEWDYTINGSELQIQAKYTPITYYATFMADGRQVAKIPFTVENTSITAPAVPAKEGYTGKWSEYTLAASDITINAVYTKNETPEPPTPTYKLPTNFKEQTAAYNTMVTVNVKLNNVPEGAKVYINGKEATVNGNTYSADIGQATSTKTVNIEVKYGTKVLDSTTLTVKVDTGFFAKLISFFSNFLFNMFSWKKVNVNF